jgi:Na+/proline symporter
LVPRQFHVTVVENHSEPEIRRAAWLFPLYLVLINLFVIPIAIAGVLIFAPGAVDSDMFVLALPLSAGSELLALTAFVGGLSAATAMVIVETVALAIMASNDLVVPFVLQRREAMLSGRENVSEILLTVRRLAIFVILVLAYLYYRLAGEAQLASIGLLSFAAVAQLAPAFFGGLIWRRATARGALAGLALYAAAAQFCRRRFGRTRIPDGWSVGYLVAASAASAWARSSAARPWRIVEPRA